MFLTNRKKYRQNITKKNAEEEEEMRKGRKKKHRNKNYSNKSFAIAQVSQDFQSPWTIDLHDRSSAELAEAID